MLKPFHHVFELVYLERNSTTSAHELAFHHDTINTRTRMQGERAQPLGYQIPGKGPDEEHLLLVFIKFISFYKSEIYL